MLTKGVIFAFGAFAGVIIMYFLFWPDITEKIVEVEKRSTDTVYVDRVEVVEIPYEKLEYVFLRDTVINEVSYPLNRYNGLEPTIYGDISYNSLIAGKMLYLNFTTDFRLPTITNTIERKRTVTQIIRPKGLYATGGINSEFNYKVGATYLHDRSLFQYQYSPQLKIHEVGVGFKLF